jgi:DNA-binding NtrC family response regulator
MKALLVDDNPLYLTLVKNWDIGIKTVSTAVDVIEEMTTHHYDMVIIDLFMPLMSGVKLHEFLTERYDTPVVIISENVDFEMKLKNVKFKYQKPMTKHRLLEIMEEVKNEA